MQIISKSGLKDWLFTQIASDSQLKHWLNKIQDMVLIDVLTHESFQKQHIPNAINVPFDNNPNFVDEVAGGVESKDQYIVVYCHNTQCHLSRKAASKLENAGYTSVWVFEEGLENWFDQSMGYIAA